MLRRQVRRSVRFLFRRPVTSLAAMVCCAFSAAGQRAMDVHETHYVLRAGEAVPIRAPQETLGFLANARTRHVDIVTPDAPVSGGRLVATPNRAGDQALLACRRNDIVTPDAPVSGGRLVATPNRAGDQVLLGASLRMNPGEYTVKLSAAGASGEERQTTLAVTVLSVVTVPSKIGRASCRERA